MDNLNTNSSANMDSNINSGMSQEQYYQEMLKNERLKAEYLRQQNEELKKMQMNNENLQRQIYEMKQRKKIAINPFSLIAAFVVILGLLLPLLTASDKNDGFFYYGDYDSIVGNETIFKWLDTLESTDDLMKMDFDLDPIFAYSFRGVKDNDTSGYQSLKLLAVGVFGFFILILLIDAFRKISTAKILMCIISIGCTIFLRSHIQDSISRVFSINCENGTGFYILIIAPIIALAGCVFDAKKRKLIKSNS